MRRARLRRWLIVGGCAGGLAVVGAFAFVGAAAVASALDSASSPPVAESVTTTDNVNTVSGATSSFGESVTPADAVNTVSGASSSVAEGITPADAVNTVAGTSSSVAETVTPADGVTVRAGASQSVGEAVSAHDAVTLQIANTPPRLVLPAQLQANEGSPLGGSGSFLDPDANQHWTATVDWGDGTPVGPLTLSSNKTFALDHVYDDNKTGGYTLTVTLSDGIATTTGTVFVDIANVAPTALLSSNGPVGEGSPATVSFSNQSDPSTADTAAGFTYAFDCGGGYGAATPSASTTCTFDDQGTYAVKGKITDKDGGATEYTISVVVVNVAPTATFTAPSTVAEGSPATLTLANPVDPSAADTAAGFTYAFDCGGGFGSASSSATATCTFDDGPSSAVVRGRIFDKDGGMTEYSATINVTNVAPSGTLGNSGPVDEGSAVSVSFSQVTDPSAADTAAGFAYSFDCDGGTPGAPSASPTVTCTYDDGPSTHTVVGRVMDKDGGFTDYTTVVTVRNVAPRATFTAPATVDEGSAIALSITNVTDPSAADTAVGFTFAFDCGDGSGFGPFGSSPGASCPTNDNGVRAVGAAVRDKDGGTTIYSANVSVRNVAPTATFVVPTSSIPEGQTYTMALTNPHDASSVDTAAGFTYAFDCGAGYGAATSSSTATCTALNDPGVDVKAKIADKDGGTTEYAAHVVIGNVAPALQILAPPAGSAYPVGTTVTFAGSFTDPGIKDTHTAQWSFDALTTPGAVTETNGSGTVSGTFTFTSTGVYSVTLTVTDNSGASGTASTVGGQAELIVIFDPSRGHVTGGGWVPAGTGKTAFEFDAKYQGGVLGGSLTVTLPNGQVLTSTSLRWLVVSGTRMQLRGEGSLAGASGYSFLVTATSTPGAFRVKIWRTADGAVVYDNVPGASDDIDLASPQPLGGGSITVH